MSDLTAREYLDALRKEQALAQQLPPEACGADCDRSAAYERGSRKLIAAIVTVPFIGICVLLILVIAKHGGAL